MLGGNRAPDAGNLGSAHVDHSPHCRQGAERAVAFYGDAFGAEEVSRIPVLMDG